VIDAGTAAVRSSQRSGTFGDQLPVDVAHSFDDIVEEPLGPHFSSGPLAEELPQVVIADDAE
jgi:hypothetical protein